MLLGFFFLNPHYIRVFLKNTRCEQQTRKGHNDLSWKRIRSSFKTRTLLIYKASADKKQQTAKEQHVLHLTQPYLSIREMVELIAIISNVLMYLA